MHNTPEPYKAAPTIDTVRSSVNQLLAAWFEEQHTAAKPIGTQYAELWQTMLELSQAGGKRIRPYLTVLSYRAFGGKDIESLLPAAAAQELLHLGLLVHDDIIDRDDLRYGQSNISGSYKQRFSGKTVDPEHYAHSAALLAGDLLISGSYQLAFRAQLPPETLVAISQVLSKAVFDVGGGEFLDTVASFSPVEDFDSLHIANFKTASYSFIAPLLIGATAAGASSEKQVLLTKLGTSLGIAYQLSDDLLGTFGDPDRTGKPADSDIREKKRTYLLQQTFARSDNEQRKLLTALLAMDSIAAPDVELLRKLMVSSGAKEHVEATMRQCAKDGKKYLEALELDAQHTAALEALIDKAVWRNH